MNLGTIGWPLAIVALVLIALGTVGIITLATSLTVAIALGLMIVGGTLLFIRGGVSPVLAVLILLTGLSLFFLRDSLPSMSIADAKTAFLGGAP